MPEKTPLFLTSRKFQQVVKERDAARDNLAEFNELRQYLGLAREIRQESRREEEKGADQATALEMAVRWAIDAEKKRLIEEYARSVRAELTEEQKVVVKEEFLKREALRIKKEVAEEVSKEAPRLRDQVARETEAELRRSTREDVLKKLETIEAQKVLERMGRAALKAAERDTLVEEIKAKAQETDSVDISDIPLDNTIVIGLGKAREASSGSSYARYANSFSAIYDEFEDTGIKISSFDRALKARVVDPAKGVLEVLDDTWMDHEDILRRDLALPDLTILNLPDRGNGYRKPRLSRGVEPCFSDESGEVIKMHGLEVVQVILDETALFD